MSEASSKSASRRGVTEQRHQDLRERLLAAAERAIAAGGLLSLRARALADEVGCSVGAIYSVFPDLDALILAVNGRTLDAIDAAMRETEPGIGAAEHLARLADSYLSFAVANRQRWRALFQHQLPPGRAITSAYAQRQAIAFSWVEAPLVNLQPGLAPPSRALLARSLFAAVHGMVELGLDEKVAEMPLPVLRDQIRLIVRAVASGLARG